MCPCAPPSAAPSSLEWRGATWTPETCEVTGAGIRSGGRDGAGDRGGAFEGRVGTHVLRDTNVLHYAPRPPGPAFPRTHTLIPLQVKEDPAAATMVITDRTWHHDALGHLAEAAHNDISVRRRELRRITVGYTNANERRAIHVRKIRAVREVAFDPTEATHTASRGGAAKHIVARSTMAIERVHSVTKDGELASPSTALHGNDAARAMAAVLCGSAHVSEGDIALAPPDVALLEAQQLEQRARHDMHRHHQHGVEDDAPTPTTTTTATDTTTTTVATVADTTTAPPRRFHASRGVADEDLELQQVCTTFTSGVTETLKGAMAAHTAIKKLYTDTTGNVHKGAETWEATFKKQLLMATSTTDKDDAKKEANKEQIWKDSMGDITAKVDLFYNK